MRMAAGLTAGLCLLLASAAHAADFGGVYVHSDSLAKQADSIDAAVQGADTLKPYDDQLANLAAFAAQEDLAAATLAVARRDAQVQYLISRPMGDAKAPDQRSRALVVLACARLAALTAPASENPADPPPASGPCGDPARLESGSLKGLDLGALRALAPLSRWFTAGQVDTAMLTLVTRNDINRFKRDHPTSPVPACDSVKTQMASASEPTIARDLDTIDKACQAAQLLDSTKAVQRIIPPDQSVADWVAKSLGENGSAEAKQAASQLLADQIAAAKAKAKTAELPALTALQTKIQNALDAPTPVLQAAGWSSVQNDLSQMTAAVGCAGAATCQATLKGAYGEGSAALGMLDAIVGARDVYAGRVEAAHWLAAAQAIVSALKTDAKLLAAARQAAQDADKARYRVRVQEASLLATSVLLAADQSPYPKHKSPRDPADQIGRCDQSDGFYCALSYYVASWNEGQVPAEVLTRRDLQAFRAVAVQRQKAAAVAQRSILLAATGAIKAYGDGGVDPKVIAQFLAAFGIIGIAAK